MRCIASGFRLAAMVLATVSAHAQNLSTTNINMLGNFWAAAQATNRPVTVVSFGDSVADADISVGRSIIDMMVDYLGAAGYAMSNYKDQTLAVLTNGAELVTGPTPLWFMDYYQLPPSGSIYWWTQTWWDPDTPTNGVYSDKLGVFWIAQPQGGTMTFSVSTEGGPWMPMLTISGYAETPTGMYTNVVVAPDYHQIRVDAVSGTNYIVGPQLLSQASNGVQVTFMYKGGIALSDIRNVPDAIRTPIMAGLSPDLLIWHMKEDGTSTTSNELVYLDQWFSNAIPSCSIVYIGTYYISVDTNPATAVTVAQNLLVHNTAIQNNRTYCDLMTPSISYPWMNAQGFMGDGTHTTPDGGLYLAGFMWNELFYALGANLPPSAGFTATPTNGAIPMAVTFADLSSGSTTNWYWSFGDGGTTDSNTKSVSYTYATAGTYTVTEIVKGSGGAATNTSVNYIIALTPSANFTGSPTNGVIPLTVKFADSSIGTITNWHWSFGDGGTTNVTTTNVSHTYATAGNYTVTEIVSGPSGSLTNIQPNYITAEQPPPSASFTAAPTGGVAPLTVIFSDASTGGPVTVWSWSFGDNSTTIVTTTNVSHSYATAGNYTVTETVSGPGGSSTKTRINCITVISPTEASQFQEWLTQYFNCTNCVQSLMSADADGTGQNNLFKYTAGLNPTNPASIFVVQPATVQNLPGQFSFQFAPVVAGRFYSPQFCTNLVSGVWLPLTNYAGPVFNGSRATITDLNATQPNEFYRLAISLATNLPTFAITSITLTGKDVTLAWNGNPGTNVVQAANGSYSSNFFDLSTIVMPAFGVTNYTDSGAATNAPARFYRIELRQ
ncbi:MAG: PKD domain-containing protein [Verrucomicrobiia bacterium]